MTLATAVAAAFLSGCASNGNQLNLDGIMAQFEAEYDAIYNDSSLSEAQQDAAAKELMTSLYAAHKDDSVGLQVFVPLITNCCTPEEAQALYDEASQLIRENDKVIAKVESFKYIESSSEGNPYKEVTGIDPLTGEQLSLSSFIGGDKPVLVDFWASWCPPCRQTIKNHLIELAASGKVTIVGIAVWEESIDDTRKAMSELGITWPVIYTGGRTGSPSIIYGVFGIPSLVLISPDGIILSRVTDIDEMIAGL